MLVPIGAWCRTAFQVRRYVEFHGLRQRSYPFDWTITPFDGLIFTLTSGDAEAHLRYSSLRMGPFGSAIDLKSGIIFHHDLPDWRPGMAADGTLLEHDYRLSELVQAQQRFRHALDNLRLLSAASHKVGFVRWRRLGHPDRHLPSAFEGEADRLIVKALEEFLGHSNFGLLSVVTRECNESVPDPVSIGSDDGISFGAVISERPGFDGAGDPEDFRGDTDVWRALLDIFCRDAAIDIRAAYESGPVNAP